MATTAKDWKGRANQAVELELPSGNTALIRNPGMQAFLQAGIVPNELLGVIMSAIDTNEMPDLQQMAEDPDNLQRVLTLVDNVTVYCVVEPPVEATPAKGVERDEEVLYADEVDINDKMFIFQFAVGGSTDLEEFRKATDSVMESLPAKSTVARPAKRASRPKAKRSR